MKKLRAKTAHNALATPRLAVLIRVMEVYDSGKSKVQVLEWFNGSAVDVEIEISTAPVKCVGQLFTMFIHALEDTVTAYHKHPPRHDMLEPFR